MFIFLDESGDLGFDWTKGKTSPVFVITILVCENHIVQKGFSTAISRTLRNKLNHKSSTRKVEELKGSKTTLEIKRYFLSHAPKDGWSIYSIIVNKERVYPHLKTKTGKKKLYNYISRLLIEGVTFLSNEPFVTLCLDKCKNTEEIKDFNTYIQNQLEGLLPLNTRLNISHEASQNNAALQAVDLFCWGIAPKYKTPDTHEWYDAFKHKIVLEEFFLG